LKGIRWLILKRPEKLDDDKGELERLERALQLNEPLAIAYYMGDELRLLWCQGTASFTTLADVYFYDPPGCNFALPSPLACDSSPLYAPFKIRSRSRSRYERPLMLSTWHLWSNLSSSAVVMISSPARTSSQSLTALLVVIMILPRW